MALMQVWGPICKNFYKLFVSIVGDRTEGIVILCLPQLPCTWVIVIGSCFYVFLSSNLLMYATYNSEIEFLSKVWHDGKYQMGWWGPLLISQEGSFWSHMLFW